MHAQHFSRKGAVGLACLLATAAFAGCEDEETVCCNSCGFPAAELDTSQWTANSIAYDLYVTEVDAGFDGGFFDGGAVPNPGPAPTCPSGTTPESWDCYWATSCQPTTSSSTPTYWDTCPGTGVFNASAVDDGAASDVAVNLDIQQPTSPEVDLLVYDTTFSLVGGLMQSPATPLTRITTRLARGKTVRYTVQTTGGDCLNWASITAPGAK